MEELPTPDEPPDAARMASSTSGDVESKLTAGVSVLVSSFTARLGSRTATRGTEVAIICWKGMVTKRPCSSNHLEKGWETERVWGLAEGDLGVRVMVRL